MVVCKVAHKKFTGRACSLPCALGIWGDMVSHRQFFNGGTSYRGFLLGPGTFATRESKFSQFFRRPTFSSSYFFVIGLIERRPKTRTAADMTTRTPSSRRSRTDVVCLFADRQTHCDCSKEQQRQWSFLSGYRTGDNDSIVFPHFAFFGEAILRFSFL